MICFGEVTHRDDVHSNKDITTSLRSHLARFYVVYYNIVWQVQVNNIEENIMYSVNSSDGEISYRSKA